MATFGEQRLMRPNLAERLLFRLMGVPDPAHYLHAWYLRRALAGRKAFAPEQILDAGCGSGDYSFFLARCYPSASVLGVDLDPRLIAQNRETAQRLGIGNVRFEVADLAQVDLGLHFDLILSIDVLEHIVQQQEALRRLARLLRTGGLAFYHLPTIRQRPVPFSWWLTGFHAWAEEEHVAQPLTADQFVARVESSGLEILQASRTFGYFTGELATSLFLLPFSNRPWDRFLRAMVTPFCRLLARADVLNLEKTRYAVAVLATSAREPQPT